MKNSNSRLKSFARINRKNPTWGESALWRVVRNKQLMNLKFRRQHPIANYIVDFYCEELRLIIEIDGSSHDETNFDKDKKREEELKRLGYSIIRFTEYEVRFRINDVLETLTLILSQRERR